MGLWPTQGDEKCLGPATTLYGAVVLSFVIPSEAEGPAVPRTFRGNVYRPEDLWTCGPTKSMKNAFYLRLLPHGSAALAFVISTEAQRSGETCGCSCSRAEEASGPV
jgi:hypothetical protein